MYNQMSEASPVKDMPIQYDMEKIKRIGDHILGYFCEEQVSFAEASKVMECVMKSASKAAIMKNIGVDKQLDK